MKQPGVRIGILKEIEMNRASCRLLAIAMSLSPLLAGAALAQVGGPNDYDLKLVPEKKLLKQGDTVAINSTIAVRKPGVLGWSYGVKHDPALLDLTDVTTEGTDVPALFKDGFNQTKIVT